MPSDNASGAANQQERLVFASWIVGFVDGEGCFTVSIFKHPASRLRLRWQVFPEFVITQGARSVAALEKAQKFFRCGALYANKRYDNHHEHLVKYVVRNREDLLSRIIPFFESHPLQTEKRKDFRIFARVVRMMNRGDHLKQTGLEGIREMVGKMNTKKRR